MLIQTLLDIIPCTCVLLVLHFLRRAVSTTPLTMMLGVFLVLSILNGLPNFGYEMQSPYSTGPLSFGAAAFPVFTVLLLIYELQGPKTTQHLLLGLLLTMVFTGLFVTLLITAYSPSLFRLVQQQTPLLHFIEGIRRTTYIYIILHLLLLLALPVVFQALRNFRLPFGLSLLACNLLILMGREMTIVYLYPVREDAHFTQTWLLRLSVITATSLITDTYLRLTNPHPVEQRKIFVFLTSLFRHFQSTDKLRRSMEEWVEKYQTVLDHTSERILVIGEQGLLINCNPATIKAFGNALSHVRFLGDILKNPDGSPFCLPETQPGNENDTRTFQHLTMTVDGAERVDTVDVNLTHATLEGERITILFAHDRTEQYEQERQKELLKQQLYHSQRLESLGLLAGGVAHDFNNMLHSIQGSTDRLRHAHRPAETPALLDTIDTAIERAADLTKQLLGFARKGNYNVETVDIGHLARQAGRLFASSAGNIDFKTLVEPGDLAVRCDPVQLQQVILNLLFNARDAVTREETAAPPKIVLRVEQAASDMPAWEKRPARTPLRPEDCIAIRVRDNGTGIPAEVLDHIFEPFFTTKKVGQGTGMGLAMAYGCITGLHGWIDVRTAPEHGTEFVIILPRDTRNAKPYPMTPPKDTP